MQLVVAVQELDARGLGEVLAEHVARARLERLAVTHHRLDRVRCRSAPGNVSFSRLAAADDGDGEPVLGTLRGSLEAGRDLVGRFLLRGMEGVRLLPQELGRAQEEARAQLPADDVVPQVEEQRQVAIGLDPVLDLLGDDRLARRPDGQPLG